ncbi:hypothetical protein J4436_04130 [Candidatus Woesearchaeota archaeon]|nr:hypothetical protein [Candidatus Woesearchaeota archaeon]
MKVENLITYETLYEILRLEKFKKELQCLNNEFYKDVINYLKDKKNILLSQENKDSVFTSQSVLKTRKQIENIHKILRELYERRESKIVQMAMFHSRIQTNTEDKRNLLKEEEEFFNNLVELFVKYRIEVLDSILAEKIPDLNLPKNIKTEEKHKKNIVKFLEFIPKFIGEDLNMYGPYEINQEVELPLKIIEILENTGKVEKI